MTNEQINAAITEYNYTLVHLHDRIANMAATIVELQGQLKQKEAELAALRDSNVVPMKADG